MYTAVYDDLETPFVTAVTPTFSGWHYVIRLSDVDAVWDGFVKSTVSATIWYSEGLFRCGCVLKICHPLHNRLTFGTPSFKKGPRWIYRKLTLLILDG